MIKIILIVVAVAAIAFILLVAIQPADFTVERSTTIDAPPEKVFPLVNDFHQWTWNPWAKLDPNIKITYSDPAVGKGATYKWAGNSNVGEGGITITESNAPELVKIKLDFIKPFAGTNLAEFNFNPVDGKTNVTWTMTGTKNFIMKGMGMFMSMDKMIGTNFEQGLAEMKAIAEKK